MIGASDATRIGDVMTALLDGIRGRQPLALNGYEPPYDSPIEDLFAWQACKLLHPEVRMIPQFAVYARPVTYRLDFALLRGPHFIAVECDGRPFHDPVRDEQRDYHVLSLSQVQRIYRFRGQDLWGRMHGCLEVLRRSEPWMFEPRAGAVLESGVANVDRPGEVLHVVRQLEPAGGLYR